MGNTKNTNKPKLGSKLGKGITPRIDVDAELAQAYGSTRHPESPTASKNPVVKPVPFTNQLTPQTWLRLQQLTYWSRERIQDILEQALNKYFDEYPDSDRELPMREQERLAKRRMSR